MGIAPLKKGRAVVWRRMQVRVYDCWGGANTTHALGLSRRMGQVVQNRGEA